MSEQQVVLEDKKTKKKRWQQIIDAAKEALEKNDNTKKGIIKKTAELLEKNGMSLEMICGTISRELHGFASKNYVTECLDSKYKDMTQSHPITRTRTRTKPKVEVVGNVALPNDAKNLIEQKEEEGESEKSMLPETVDEESQFDLSLSSNGQQQQSEVEEEKEEEQPQEFDEIIRPEDYIIEDLPKYSSQLKDRIIIYLDEEVKRLNKLTKEVQSRNN